MVKQVGKFLTGLFGHLEEVISVNKHHGQLRREVLENGLQGLLHDSDN